MNPCNQCLVVAACNYPCEEFNNYLETNLPPKHSMAYWHIAHGVRAGRFKLLYFGNYIFEVKGW